jgi:nicotinic acid mononucleotide adenylyltransferase
MTRDSGSNEEAELFDVTFSQSLANTVDPASAAAELACSSFATACQRASLNVSSLENLLQHKCVGIGCVSNNDGTETHFAASTKNETLVWQLTHAHELAEKSSAALLYSLARVTLSQAAGIMPPDGLVLLREHLKDEDPITQMLNGNASSVTFSTSGEAVADIQIPRGCLIFPGSFNPLHEGHTGMVEAAAASLNARGETIPGVAYEISADHPDKGCLSRQEILSRVQQFRGISPVIVSRLPLYVEKSKFYPSCSFVIGADVCRKILDPKYTGESIAQMYCDLEQIRGRGCRFLVAGRKNSITEEFETVDTILEEKILNHVDREAISNLFQPVNGFRVDLSSSEIRKSEGEKEGKL